MTTTEPAAGLLDVIWRDHKNGALTTTDAIAKVCALVDVTELGAIVMLEDAVSPTDQYLRGCRKEAELHTHPASARAATIADTPITARIARILDEAEPDVLHCVPPVDSADIAELRRTLRNIGGLVTEALAGKEQG